MNALPIILTLWGLAVSAFVALMVYRTHLERHESAELFIGDVDDFGRESRHNEIVNKVNRIQPFVQTAGGAMALLSVLMIGVYVANLLPYVKL